MGNKTRKDGAFKGERTRLVGRGEERVEGGKGKKGESAKASTSRTSRFLLSPFFLVPLFSRRYQTRYYDDQRRVYIDINAIYSREISSFELSPITDEWSEREREDYYENLKKNRGK